MSGAKFTDEPKRVVAEQLGVSTKSIDTWQRLFSRPTKLVPDRTMTDLQGPRPPS